MRIKTSLFPLGAVAILALIALVGWRSLSRDQQVSEVTVSSSTADAEAIWQALIEVVRSRGETIASADQQSKVLITASSPLSLAQLKEVAHTEFLSDWKEGQYRLEIRLVSNDTAKVSVMVNAKMECWGWPRRGLGRPPDWQDCPSNGKIEQEVLKAFNQQIASGERTK